MNILEKILETKKEEVDLIKKEYSISSFESMEFYKKQNLSLYKILKNKSHLSIIAEIKKSSPSKGVIKKDFDHFLIAQNYLDSGMDAISILTDEKYFEGKICYLQEIARISNVPLLRKDFIIDEFQIFQSKAFGADVILLIAEAISKTQIKDFTQTALGIGLEVLLEIHSEEQLNKIDFDANKIIGINNRDLTSFIVDINTTLKLKKILPMNVSIISESGISNKDNIQLLKTNNINGVLVGEHFMKSENIENELAQFKEWCKIES
jgi:indole-3-glycerol phosphate synthase